jgi:hypothetical protein
MQINNITSFETKRELIEAGYQKISETDFEKQKNNEQYATVILKSKKDGGDEMQFFYEPKRPHWEKVMVDVQTYPMDKVLCHLIFFSHAPAPHGLEKTHS